jgi:hypothetical protein
MCVATQQRHRPVLTDAIATTKEYHTPVSPSKYSGGSHSICLLCLTGIRLTSGQLECHEGASSGGDTMQMFSRKVKAMPLIGHLRMTRYSRL